MEPVTIALAIGGAVAAPILATALLFRWVPKLLDDPEKQPPRELGEPKPETPWSMEEADDVVRLTSPDGSQYYLEDGSWYHADGSEVEWGVDDALDNQHQALLRAKKLADAKRTEEKKAPPGIGFFTREHGRTLYIDEHGNGFRFTQDQKGHQKFVRYPSGADIADPLEHQRIFDLWHQWNKLNHDNNVLLNKAPPKPETRSGGFSKSADGQWIVYVDVDGKEYRQSVGAYDVSWYNFPEGDKVEHPKSSELHELLKKHTETSDADQRRKKWSAEAGS